MGHRRGPSMVSAPAATGNLLPIVEDVIYRLDGTGRKRGKVQAWTNPAYSDTTITVAEPDLVEEMYPNGGRNMLRRMSYQFWAVLVLTVAHIMVTAYTDPIYLKSPLTQVIVYSGQAGLLLAIIGGFFVLTSQTLYIRLGRYDLYLREFAAIYILFLLEVVLYLALKSYATILIYKRMSYLALWDAKGYTPLWVTQRIALILFWAAAIYSCLSVFDLRYFDPKLVFGQQEKARERRRRKELQTVTSSG